MPKKSFFTPVDSKINFSIVEKKLLNFWYKGNIVKKYLGKNKSSKKIFSFIDGPITANNPMGVHHAWGRTYKDLWQKYKNMQGFCQRFQNGFDCQGLWVEVGVERDLGFNSKKDIERYGLAKFAQACKKTVKKFSDIQTEQSKRLGQFMDWENSYYTYSDKNIEYIWYFLKKCHEKKWLYRGFRSLPWCARCGTSLSQHELTDSYKEMTHQSVFFKLPVSNKTNQFFLVWTTTPWTLAANVALAVNPQVIYVEAKVGNEIIILAEKLLNVLKDKYSIVSKFKGEKLLGLKYIGPFDELPAQKESQRCVIGWDEVSEEEGTGIVHIAPGCGEEDFELGKKYKLSVLVPIDEYGIYISGYGSLMGKFAHDVNNQVFSSLQDKRFLYKIENYKHQYPICWRCHLPIVFRAEENWFISSEKVRPKMMQEAKKVKWYPKYAGKLMQDWLKNMGDWNISRKRYFGLPLPFYICQCGNTIVVESLEELKKLAINKKEVDKLPELHRPWIDKIIIKCPKCKRSVNRITDVGDCWLDAGIVPFSTLKYLEDKAYWAKWFPAQWITEMREQIRLWFYSMLFMSVTLEEKTPYLNVLSYEKVYDEKGRPMHKSAGNAIWFDEAAEKMGVDVMRWMYINQNPSDNLLFGFKVADEIRRKFHIKLWNIYNFFVTYANFEGWSPDTRNTKQVSKRQINSKFSMLDKWILARLNELIDKVTKSLDVYDAFCASSEIEKFIEDLSNWYIRRSRERVGVAAESKEEKEKFYQTTYYTLITLCKILAPFIPFLADEIYKNLTKEKSVHLCDWPDYNSKLKAQNSKLINEMTKVREVVEKIHSLRKEKHIVTRQPLNSFSTTYPMPKIKFLEDLIKDETNIKKIYWNKKQNLLDTNITQILKEEAKVRELIREIQEARKKMGLNLTQKAIVYAPWIPQKKLLLNAIQKKTLTTKIFKSKKFRIVAVK